MIITFITTINHNVGDDFVRDGIKYLLQDHFENIKINYQYVHKHVPVTVRNGFENIRSLRLSERIEKYVPKSLTPDKIRNADIVIQSGAPLYWFHSERNASFRNEWYPPLIEKRFLKLKRRKILMNIGVGACQQYYSNGDEFLSSQKFIEFVKRFYNQCNLTTVRDELSYQLLKNLHFNAVKLPCPSIFSSDFHQIKPKKGDFVLLNYMPTGGHYDFAGDLDADRWEKSFLSFYEKIRTKEKIVFACHDEKEFTTAKRLFPESDLFFSKNYRDYIDLYSRAKFGIVNRVHAGFQLASSCKPSIIIGSDSRARMASEIGLESLFVNDVDDKLLFYKYDNLKKIAEKNDFAFQIQKLKKLSKTIYLDLFNRAINDGEI